ncbi:MAG: peptide ABC transporter substrate-binding protein [Beijerinckiaceae bacterium]|nr:peptide ABC transporter substrate-binding protein [Beijerinckiaceae bacterium]
MWKLALPILLLLVALGVAASTDPPRPRADLVINNSGDLNTLDIHRMTWMKDLRVAGALWEGLVSTDLFTPDLRIRPAVASSWEISPDSRTYTFHLRPEARWSNGSPVTSRDFRETWRRACTVDAAGDYIGLFKLIKGVGAYCDWREGALKAFAEDPATPPPGPERAAAARALWQTTLAKFDELVGLRTPDEHTLVVELERPTAYFLGLCAFEPLGPLSMPVVDRFQSIDPVSARVVWDQGWTKPPNLVTNGPFVVSSWRFKRDMRLDQNPHYWNAAAISVRSIDIPAADDPNAQVLSFLSGSVDWVADVSVDYKRDLLARKRQYIREHQALFDSLAAQGLDPVAIDRRMPPDPRQNIHAFPAFGTYFFNFMCSPTLADGRANPFADARVRRAFAMAVDRRAVSELRGIDERPVSTLIPPGGIPGYTSPTGVPSDASAARSLLAQAGHSACQGLPTIEILINKDGGHDLVAQSIARDWQRELGAQVVIVTKEIKAFREDLHRKNFMVSRAGWFGDYADPTTFLDLNRSTDGNNDRGYASPAFDALLDRAADEPDAGRRMRLLEAAEALLVNDDCPIIPLVQYSQLFLFDPHRLSGISPHTRQKQSLQLLEILGDGIGAEKPREMERPVAPSAAQSAASPPM